MILPDYGGLEQTIANWAKCGGASWKVVGGRLPWLLSGHSSLRTDRRAMRIYRTLASNSGEPRCSLQLTSSSPGSLAFFVRLSPPTRAFLPYQPLSLVFSPWLMNFVSPSSGLFCFSSSSRIQDSFILPLTICLHTQGSKMLPQKIVTMREEWHSQKVQGPGTP